MSSCGKFCPIDTDVNSSCPCNAQFWYLPSLPFLPESLFVPIATSAGSAGRPAVVTSGTKPVLWPERTKSLIVATLKLGLQESDKLIELPPICANAITAYTKIGVILLDPTNVKSAITTFRSTSLNAGSVESWLVVGAGGIDYETLV